MPETHSGSSMYIAALQGRLERMLPEALDVLREMVNTNSFTRNAAGVDRVGDLTWQLFESLGFTADRPQAIDCTMEARPAMGRHLLMTRPGRSGLRIGLTGHLDTVFTEQEEREHDFRWREEGERIYGPGTVDMKGGNVLSWMVLAAIREVHPALFDEVTWVVMFNAAEEGLDSDFGVHARRCLGPGVSPGGNPGVNPGALANLVFEGGHLVEGEHRLLVKRKGSARLRIRARGRGAHAGVWHERGANAIVQLIDCLGQTAKLTDYERELTCNIGVIRGGMAPNRVPDFAEALVELRAYDPAVLEQAIAEGLRIDGMSTVCSAADGYAARVEAHCEKHLPPWASNAGSDRLAAMWREAGARLGMAVVGTSRGGLSDGNHTYDVVPTLDGLGPAGGNSHSCIRAADGSVDQEFMLPSTFVPRAAMTALAVERLVAEAGKAGRGGGVV
ncbi:M20/M25/M40 family metallo-hydrolase [Phycisphaerales bacterium AB-hyl4]|uniref:M20/M25/M40 family metallo-hydrolase n=1 Tax=Natronomicrosphaera hydrolytica TaxID=3242702 RepID=A0ABV4U9L5_9BACT